MKTDKHYTRVGMIRFYYARVHTLDRVLVSRCYHSHKTYKSAEKCAEKILRRLEKENTK